MPSAGSITGNYVTNLNVVNGLTTVTFGNKANIAISGSTILLSPNTKPGSITWRCKSVTIDGKYLPTICRS